MTDYYFGYTKDPTTIPPKIEKALRKELGTASPLAYQLESRNMDAISGRAILGTLGKDIGMKALAETMGGVVSGAVGGILGGVMGGAIDGVIEGAIEKEATILCIMHFTLTQPRPAELHVYVLRHGAQSFTGNIIFNVSFG